MHEGTGEPADSEWLAARFERHRARLRAVAYRMLGSSGEAEDAVQEAWLRASRAGTGGVENLGGWLTTITSRVCLDMLRARRARREEPLGLQVAGEEVAPERATAAGDATAAGLADPEQELLLADSLGLALLVVLDELAPAERVAFVLHDMFAVPYPEVAQIVGRTEAAARQLASRARRRVRGAGVATAADVDVRRQREIVAAFLAACRSGDLAGLLELLDPDVVTRSDGAAVAMGSDVVLVTGADAVARSFTGRAGAARPALLGGLPGLVWMYRGKPQVAFAFTVSGGLITQIDLIADPAHLRRLDVAPLRG